MIDVISSIYLFIFYLIVICITFALVLILVQFILSSLDVNPFTWHAMTTRRLSDPLINPVKRRMRNVRIPPKYAPLVTILLVLLVGWFSLQLAAGILNTLAGVLLAATARDGKAVIGYLLYGLLALYGLMIFIRIMLSWVTVSYANRFMRFLVIATDPLLVLLRKRIPPVGMFDISALVALIIVWLLQAVVQSTLLRGLPLGFFG